MVSTDTDGPPTPDEIEEARAMRACPYFNHEGTCGAEPSCYSEPRCITDQPVGGWGGVLKRAGVRP